MTRARAAALALLAIAAPGPARADDAAPAAPSTLALRAGWAYGLGLEVEYRPGRWGIGASGGYVPGLGPGGYLGVQWGMRPIDRRGVVAEAGVFRGVHNPLRAADDGVGVHALAGYTVVRRRLSLRAVAGGGVPLTDPDHRPSFELLAKLTVGVTFPLGPLLVR